MRSASIPGIWLDSFGELLIHCFICLYSACLSLNSLKFPFQAIFLSYLILPIWNGSDDEKYNDPIIFDVINLYCWPYSDDSISPKWNLNIEYTLISSFWFSRRKPDLLVLPEALFTLDHGRVPNVNILASFLNCSQWPNISTLLPSNTINLPPWFYEILVKLFLQISLHKFISVWAFIFLTLFIHQVIIWNFQAATKFSMDNFFLYTFPVFLYSILEA